MMRTRAAVVLAAATVGSLSLFSPAQASHSWAGYHWGRSTSPFTLKLGDDVDVNWDSYLVKAGGDWAGASALDTSVVSGVTTGRKCRAATGRVEVCNAAYGNNGWLGLASISLSGKHITQGTAKMNDTYFNTVKYNNAAERQDVMCQEVGHTLGLDHTSTDGSTQSTCMDYSTTADVTTPNSHDFEQLAAIYTHTDATITVAASAASSGSDVGNDRSSWGREVARSANGAESTFVRNLGNDESVVTFVTWAS